MSLLSFILASVFSVVLCIVEIPKMRKNREKKELVAFLIILFYGLALVGMKCLKIDIPNPADVLVAVYSPVVDLIKVALE
ncbi:MAG: hypothetical protein P4L45_02005 [Ignavibacteriaceae bacterium]|nr:hypothetical protein [Ignavibacteriaceae bacterium]